MPRALLLIADIGGYTRFMKVHRINLAHAQYVVGQLLEAVIDAAPRAYTVAKLEGDAAFFYATLPEVGQGDSGKFGGAVAAIRRAFLRRRAELVIDRACTCDGCVQASELKLKFVGHVGEIAFQKVKRFREVAGVDVIHVHRLLKNSVPLSEYVLMSEPLKDSVEEALRAQVTALDEHLEGLGDARSFYVDLASTVEAPVTRASSALRRLFAWLKMTLRSLPFMVGVRTPCDGFRNMRGILVAGTSADPAPKELA